MKPDIQTFYKDYLSNQDTQMVIQQDQWKLRETEYRGRSEKKWDFKRVEGKAKSFTQSKWDTQYQEANKKQNNIQWNTLDNRQEESIYTEVQSTSRGDYQDTDSLKDPRFKYYQHVNINQRIQKSFANKMENIQSDVVQDMHHTNGSIRDNIQALKYQQRLLLKDGLSAESGWDFIKVKSKLKRIQNKQQLILINKTVINDKTNMNQQTPAKQLYSLLPDLSQTRNPADQYPLDKSDITLNADQLQDRLNTFKKSQQIILNNSSSLKHSHRQSKQSKNTINNNQSMDQYLQQEQSNNNYKSKHQYSLGSHVSAYKNVVYQALTDKLQMIDKKKIVRDESYQGFNQESNNIMMESQLNHISNDNNLSSSPTSKNRIKSSFALRLDKIHNENLSQLYIGSVKEEEACCSESQNSVNSSQQVDNADQLFEDMDKESETNLILNNVTGNMIEELDQYLKDIEEFSTQILQEKKHLEFKKQLNYEKRKQEQYDIFKNFDKAKVKDTLKDDPRFNFIQICKKEGIKPMSILHQLTKSMITLKDVKIGRGLMRALAGTINQMEDCKLRHIYMENNGIDDDCFSLFLTQLSHRLELQSVTLIQNSLSSQTISTLLDLSYELSPYKFEELRLAKCQLRIPMSEFIQKMMQKTSIRKLALVSMDINDSQMGEISEYVKSNSNLKELDLSWNKAQPKTMLRFIEKMTSLNQLQSLNLSWNSLKIESDKLMNQVMTSFLQNSSNLIHLDLSNCHLPEKILFQMAQQAKVSLTLQALHFSENNVTKSLKSKIRSLLNTKDYYLKDIKSRTYQRDDPTRPQSPVHNISFQHKTSTQMIEGMNKKALKESLIGRKTSLSFDSGFSIKYNLWRIIGQNELSSKQSSNERLPQWYESDDCWVCSKWKYYMTLCLDSEFRGYIDDEEEIEGKFLNMQEKLGIQDHIEILEVKQPYIIGTFTNWKLVKMQKLVNILLQLDPNSSILSSKYPSEQSLWSYYRKVWPLTLPKNLSYKVFFDRYPREQLGTLGLAENDTVWAYNDFVPAGNHQYFILYRLDDSEMRKLWFSTTVKLRKEDVQKNIIEKKQRVQKQRYFIKSQSVFKEWQEDTDVNYQKIIEIDQELWKVNRLVKDQQDYLKCKEILLNNLPYLLQIYKHLISSSNYPQISWNDVTQFATQVGLFDSQQFGLSTFDRLYIATNSGNTSKADGQQQSSQDLKRCQFLEMLVRIAGNKYRDTQIYKTYSEALSQFMRDYLLVNYALRDQVSAHEKIRHSQVWRLQVNDILFANLLSLKKIFNSVILKQKEKTFTVKNAVDLIQKDFNVLDKDIVQQLCLSKMTVIQDDDKSQHLKLFFVEFLEFLVRIGLLINKNSQEQTHKKVESVITTILTSNCMKYIEFQEGDMDDEADDCILSNRSHSSDDSEDQLI